MMRLAASTAMCRPRGASTRIAVKAHALPKPRTVWERLWEAVGYTAVGALFAFLLWDAFR